MLNNPKDCPQAVLDCLANSDWEDIEPFDTPAQIKGKDIDLQNVWALWRGEQNDMHAVDYTDSNLRHYIFTGAYPVAVHDDLGEDTGPVIVRDFEFSPPK
ncbi:MAG: hypothetical protein PHW33_03645 [Candidatus Portnoybacteria bacterium]|nr:hypothetical protein [Candidatus Portnoybacteria bacterium]